MSPRISTGLQGSRTYRDYVMSAVGRLGPSENAEIDDLIQTAVTLAVLLFLVVPVLALGVGVPLLVTIPAAGAGYIYYLVRTDRVFTGFVSGFFVLVVFRANVPVAAATSRTVLNVYLVDPIALLLLTVLLYDFQEPFEGLTDTRLGVVGVTAFATFVVWSYLSALVGNGSSQFAAVVFSIEQTRYLLFFVVAALVVRRTDVRFGLYPLLLSIGGNLFYAVAEAVSGQTFGLTYLGDTDGKLISEFTIGPWIVESGFYAGGYVGQTRELIALVLLLVPFVVFLSIVGRTFLTVAGGLTLSGTAFIVRLGETDAGMMSLLVLLGLVGIVCVIYAFSIRRWYPLRGVVLTAYGTLATLVLYADRFTASDGTRRVESGTGSGAATENMPLQTQITALLDVVPGVRVDTLGIRLVQYTAAIDIALKYPLFGIGGYNFYQLSASYGLPESLGIHNTFFSHLAATGIPGVLAYTVAVGAVVVLAGYRSVRRTGRTRLLWGCALAALLGFHAFSFWVVIYSWVGANAGFWAFSGLIVGGRMEGAFDDADESGPN